MERKSRQRGPQHGVNQTDSNEVIKRSLGHDSDGKRPAKALLDVIIEIKGAGRERDASLAESFSHGDSDGVGVVDDGEQSGLVEVVAAETDLERSLDDGGLLRGRKGGVELGKGAVDEGEGDVVDGGGAVEGEGEEAASGVDEGMVARLAFGQAAARVLEGRQVNAVDGRGGVEMERVGLDLEGDVGRRPVVSEPVVEARVPALGALVARGGRLAEVAGEIRVAVEGDGDLVAVGRVGLFGVDVALLRDKGTFGHHGSGVGDIVDAI